MQISKQIGYDMVSANPELLYPAGAVADWIFHQEKSNLPDSVRAHLL